MFPKVTTVVKVHVISLLFSCAYVYLMFVVCIDATVLLHSNKFQIYPNSPQLGVPPSRPVS